MTPVKKARAGSLTLEIEAEAVSTTSGWTSGGLSPM
jgi:hypothetical protein